MRVSGVVVERAGMYAREDGEWVTLRDGKWKKDLVGGRELCRLGSGLSSMAACSLF